MTSNLTVDNLYNIFCNTLTAKTVVSTNRPQETQIGNLCVTTTLSDANTPGGTPAHTLVVDGLSIFFNNINGVCYLWKAGTSGVFPTASQNVNLKNNLAATNTLYILAKSENPIAADGGGVYLPPNALPICESNTGDKVYIGSGTMNLPLKQNSANPVGTSGNPVIYNVHTENANGQYIEIIIPRTYDYIVNGNNGINGTVDTQNIGPAIPLESQTVEYTRQNFSGNDTNGFQNSVPPFYLQYPTEN